MQIEGSLTKHLRHFLAEEESVPRHEKTEVSSAQTLRVANQDLFSIFSYAVSDADSSPSLGLRKSYDLFYCALFGENHSDREGF